MIDYYKDVPTGNHFLTQSATMTSIITIKYNLIFSLALELKLLQSNLF